jgi:CDP-diacylglycerol--glycerol-3-phosphate 3-phosphatidyltransferase
MISRGIGRGGKFILSLIVSGLTLFRINPNLLTFTGVLISFWAAWNFSQGRFFRGGLIVILAGLFDMLDGEVARVSRTTTRFGAFYDSVIDRYSDIIILQGLMVWYARQQMLGYVVLVGVVFMGAVMTSYTRARAESLIPKCKVGFMERPERIVLLIIGGLANRMEAVLWVLAILGNWTVFSRIYYTWRELPKPAGQQAPDAPVRDAEHSKLRDSRVPPRPLDGTQASPSH